MDERDVLRTHTGVDAEGDARGIRRRRFGHRPVGIEHEDLPEDPDVLEPLRAFDERAHIEPVRAGKRRRSQVELEPCDLAWPDVGRGLLRDAIEPGPSRRRRTELTVAAEDAGLVLTRLALPGPEVGRLAHPPRDPSTRSRVVISEGRLRGSSRAETHVSALAVPSRVKPRQLGRRECRGRDARTDIGCADGRCRCVQYGNECRCGDQNDRGEDAHQLKNLLARPTVTAQYYGSASSSSGHSNLSSAARVMPPVLNHLCPSASPPGQYAHPPSSATLNGLDGSTGGARRWVLRTQMNWMRARSISHESDSDGKASFP